MWGWGFSGLLLVVVAACVWRARAAAREAAQALAQSRGREQELTRLLRVAASDLRGPALSLLGHAEQLAPTHKATLVTVCRLLLDIAEAILDQTDDPAAQRRLREEDIALGPLLDFIVAQVASQLYPGRRVWRIAPELQDVVLRADRRALHQVLLRVMTSAALATGDGETVDVGAAAESDQWTIRVEDEGAGLPIANVKSAGIESRGLGLGLSLARSLMQAHGGGLALQSASLVGTRALLSFPLARVIAGA